MALTKATRVSSDNVTYPVDSNVEHEISSLKLKVSYKNAQDFGVKCDGETDNADALEAALLSLVEGETLVLPQGKCRIARPIIADFKGKEHIGFIMVGDLVPDMGIGSAITLKNFAYGNLELRVRGGGGPMVDYSQPDPVGMQQAFVLDSLRCVKVSVLGTGYKGRVLRTQKTGDVKTSFLNLDIRTGDSYNQCYQACYLQGSESAYGTISSAQTQWDVYGSVLDNLTDVTITYWEYGASTANHNPALTLKRLSSTHISVLAGGQGAGTGTALRIEEGVAISIDKLFTTECAVGLHVIGKVASGANEPNKQLTIGCHYSYGSNQKAVILENARNVSILDCHYDAVGDYGVVLQGVIRDVEINGYFRNPNISCIKSLPGSDVSRLKMSSRFYSSSARDLIDLSEGKVGYIQFTDCSASTNGGKLMLLQDSNKVHITGGEWVTTGSVMWDNRPEYVTGTETPKVESHGASNVYNGAGNNATIEVKHGLSMIPREVSYVWRGIPRPGAILVPTTVDDSKIVFTLVTDGAFSAQVNFWWSASAANR